MRQSLLIGAASLLAVAGAASAQAQEDKKPWTSSVELGFVNTDGNSKGKTLQGRADALWEAEQWRNNSHLEALNAEADGTRSSERYYLTNKTDYKFNERSYLFGFVSYEDDRFSGYDWQAVAAAGYGYRILDSDTMTWDMEGGPGYRISEVADDATDEDGSDDDIKEDELIVRLYTKYQWKISDQATFEQELGSEIGGEKTVSRSVTSLKSTIVGALAMKLSYIVRYTDNVPRETVHADTETAVTLVYSF